MKKLVMLAIGLIAGCSNETESSSAKSSIILACAGTSYLEAPERKEDASYLIRFNPVGAGRSSLHFFSGTEQRFISLCESRFSRCEAHASPDLITETGLLQTDDGQILMTRETTINRRTGTMIVTATDRVLGKSVLFEGSCQKGTLPTEVDAKF